jgi:dienelactone hydrolase
MQRALRDERWKLIRYPEINRTQLFDLAACPDGKRMKMCLHCERAEEPRASAPEHDDIANHSANAAGRRILAQAASLLRSRTAPTRSDMRTLLFLAALVAADVNPRALCQAPADPDANAPAKSPAQNRTPKSLPPPGVAIPEKDRTELTAGAAELAKEIAVLKLAKLGGGMSALIPDVEIFHKAVDWALRYDEFYDVKQVATARTLLAEGKARAAALREGKASWATATGPVVRGYRSKIDGSVQPFGVVVPATWKGVADKRPRATWIWNHGRNEKLSELAFIAERMTKPGEFTPDDTFVVHPYGRYCNATKFAGETDVFEALDAARRAYPVDNDRLVNAGFSMGGASAWHLGAHHSGLWAASHAGAGFAESAEYAGVFAAGKTPPPWWEVILYRWYDATICAANFANHPMFAYHGSEDKQKQATEIMQRFAEKEGVKFEHFIGPGVGHKYEPGTKKDIAAKIEAAVRRGKLIRIGRDVPMPKTFRFTTHSLVYPIGVGGWCQILGLEKQWEPAEIKMEVSDDSVVTFTTKNVSEFFLMGGGVKRVIVDGAVAHEGGFYMSLTLRKAAGKWRQPTEAERHEVRKSSDFCGPIDHAFMDEFVFVKPTGAPLNTALGAWTQRELAHATKQWRGIFRGDAPTVDDTFLAKIAPVDITKAVEEGWLAKLPPAQRLLETSNLVLWGDPSSNAVLKRIADKLPVKWSKDGLEFGGVKYDAATHVPVLIFPNPLNPRRYVVLNSGFTFSRAAASGTNSLQTPKLPDWAIVDTSVPPDDKFPGKVVDAGFFDEQWKFTKERPK